MTCIAGIAAKGAVYIGGDSQGTGGWSRVIRADDKVFTTGEFVMGFTSSFRMGQLLRYELKVPKLPARRGDLDAWMVKDFIAAVRECLSDGGFRKKENEVETGGTFLVGVRGRIYNIASDFQVGRSQAGYDAVGSGSDVALGALFATARSRLAPEERILLALRAAERFNAAVGGPHKVAKA